jgi:hypothetical protein
MTAKILGALILVLSVAAASAADYQVSRQPDGPFAFTTSFGTLNQGSTLQREAVILNDPDCPVQLKGASTGFALTRSNFALASTTDFEARGPVQAVSIRHMAFDAFGRHLESFVSTEVLDRTAGPHRREANWAEAGDLVPELLTTVTYVSRVRLSDGTQWAFDERKLLAALRQARLEAVLGDRHRTDGNRPQ